MMHNIIYIITMFQVIKLVFAKLKDVLQSKHRKKMDENIFRNRFDKKMQKLFAYHNKTTQIKTDTL